MRPHRANDAACDRRRNGHKHCDAGATVDRPLEAWRTLDRERIGPDVVATIRRALFDSVAIHDGRWPGVRRGDAASAVGVAVRVLRRPGLPSPVCDIAMSAVLVHAVTGDPAAALVLAHGLQRLARGRRDAARLNGRARLWAAGASRGPPDSRA
ncbi:hypothetical protein [Methylobacterium haplocladii]|uniref:Uncharacterized protein n=1 Tax=Methylobacterium haplocladii TaxID=1176176 RepID=A0A512IJM0_9HYPH|nr:hypothetical protein [Methylobacterium haplocladii]GEO97871.1 hypothetical protein MHA02_02590 [Methylobacterium haplocladii]GJD82715.1 hypothetical protein HPGCJGGD_0574 [Methylobacterium haplocladii]GLS57497.1 hypothetical protein GCM10007887_01520 [Methylobacterium haplocladii]